MNGPLSEGWHAHAGDQVRLGRPEYSSRGTTNSVEDFAFDKRMVYPWNRIVPPAAISHDESRHADQIQFMWLTLKARDIRHLGRLPIDRPCVDWGRPEVSAGGAYCHQFDEAVDAVRHDRIIITNVHDVLAAHMCERELPVFAHGETLLRTDVTDSGIRESGDGCRGSVLTRIVADEHLV